MTPAPPLVCLADLTSIPRRPRAIAIGNFDGVHLGHQQLLKVLTETSRHRGSEATSGSITALTFYPHPATVVAPDRAPQSIISLEDRVRLLSQHGADEVIVLQFDDELRCLSALDFVQDVLLDSLGATRIAVGANFRFGHQQHGDSLLLARLAHQRGFELLTVSLLQQRGIPFSSSGIRKLLQGGDVTRAARLLGRPFHLSGPVVSGRGVGRKVTVPTLNLAVPESILPADGVYVTRVRCGETGRAFDGITNIGVRPTFDDGHPQRSIETFVLGPLEESPDHIFVEFMARIREERQFASADALKAQIFSDVRKAERFHALARHWQPTPLRPVSLQPLNSRLSVE